MHKLCIYVNPGEGFICQDLNHRNNSSTHSSLNNLVNERFGAYKEYLIRNFDQSVATDRMNRIKAYLKNMLKHFDTVFIDFPGNLQTGELNKNEIHPLSSTYHLFNVLKRDL